MRENASRGGDFEIKNNPSSGLKVIPLRISVGCIRDYLIQRD